MLIYVCSPLRGDIENNVTKAREYCKQVIEKGHTPIAPHVMFYGILDDTNLEERAIGMLHGIRLLDICNEVWVFGRHISEGMKVEIMLAEEQGKRVEYV